MPGVKGILTHDDVPGPADYVNDNGTMIQVNRFAELALTDKPMYQGEPILAVAAVDELTAAERHREDRNRNRTSARSSPTRWTASGLAAQTPTETAMCGCATACAQEN